MKSNHKLALMLIMYGAGAFAQMNPKRERKVSNKDVLSYDPPKPETEQELAKRLGLKEWNINGKIVYSATKKKAQKLANNLK